MKIARQNRNREVLTQVQTAMTPRTHSRPHKDHTDAIHHSKEYKELASYGESAIFDSSCRGCLLAKYCSACVLVGWIITPRQCKEAKKVVAEKVLDKMLPKIQFRVREGK